MSTVVGADRMAWLARRREGIGGSDAAAVVGLHPWLSPLGLYFDKRGEVEADTEPTEAMEWGIRLEAVVAEAWAEKNDLLPRKLTLRRFPPYDPANIRVHPDHPWMLANLDGIVCGRTTGAELAVYEGKTASGWTTHDWDEGIPPYVLVQVQWQLAVTGLPVGYVACLIGGQRYVQDEVQRDEEMIDALVDAGARFWEQVQNGTPPAVDAHPNTTEVLKARWTDTLAEAVDLGTEGEAWVAERHEAKRGCKTAKERLDLVENQLKMALGEREVGTVFGEVAVTWKPDKNGTRRLSVKEL